MAQLRRSCSITLVLPIFLGIARDNVPSKVVSSVVDLSFGIARDSVPSKVVLDCCTTLILSQPGQLMGYRMNRELIPR